MLFHKNPPAPWDRGRTAVGLDAKPQFPDVQTFQTWDLGILGLWDISGLMGPWDSGTLGPWDLGT